MIKCQPDHAGIRSCGHRNFLAGQHMRFSSCAGQSKVFFGWFGKLFGLRESARSSEIWA